MGAERKNVQKCLFFFFGGGCGERNKSSKGQILLSRKFVVIAQALRLVMDIAYFFAGGIGEFSVWSGASTLILQMHLGRSSRAHPAHRW